MRLALFLLGCLLMGLVLFATISFGSRVFTSLRKSSGKAPADQNEPDA